MTQDLGISGGRYIRFGRHRVSRYLIAAGIRAIPQISYTTNTVPYRQRVSRYLLGPQSPNLIYLPREIPKSRDSPKLSSKHTRHTQHLRGLPHSTFASPSITGAAIVSMSSPKAPISVPSITHLSLPKIKLSWPSSMLTAERHEREVLPSLYVGSALLVRLVEEHGVTQGQELALSDDISECAFIVLGLWRPGTAWGEELGGWECLQLARNAARQANLLCIDKNSEMASRMAPWFIVAVHIFLGHHTEEAYLALERASVAVLGPITSDEKTVEHKSESQLRLHQLYLMALNATGDTGEPVDLINEDAVALLLSTSPRDLGNYFPPLLLSCVQDARQRRRQSRQYNHEL